jgi:two-component system nitrogen regulation response regulator GlnG
LRERGDDLPILVRHFVRRFGRDMGREIAGVAPAAIDRLQGYGWPGNVRELQNVLRQALLRAHGQVLLPEFLPELSRSSGPLASGEPNTSEGIGPSLESFVRNGLASGSENLHEETHRLVERTLLPMVLEHTDGNQRQAARILGIARKTLRDKLRELGITIQRSLDLGDAVDGDDS